MDRLSYEQMDDVPEDELTVRRDKLIFRWRASLLERVTTDSEALRRELNFLGGGMGFFRHEVLEGRLDVERVARDVKKCLDDVQRVRRESGLSEQIAYVKNLAELPMPFSKKCVGLIALMDGLRGQAVGDLLDRFEFARSVAYRNSKPVSVYAPDDVPSLPLQFLRVLRHRFPTEHSPDDIIEAALAVERRALTGELKGMGRRRRKKRPKTATESGKGIGDADRLSYPTAFCNEVARRSGASRTTVARVLAQAGYELPPELDLV